MSKFTKKFWRNILRMSAYTSLCILVVAFSASVLFAHETDGQTLNSVRITLSVRDASLANVLSSIERQSPFTFGYADEIKTIRVSLRVENKPLDQVLEQLSKQADVEFAKVNNLIGVIRRPETKRVTPAAKKSKPGTLTGQVVDENGQGLPGAIILIKNINVNTATDVEGKYTLRLEPGTYEVEFRFMGYQPQLIQGVIITDNELTSLNIAMKVDVAQLGEVVITSEFEKASVEGLLVRQKNNAAITDGISAEQIARTPDNNMGQVLKRVSGLTIQDDKFVTVRGLSERYNNVQLNGSNLPSTEPNRKNFAFDIIPSSLVSNVVVSKTATPDQTAEFSGAVVQVNTIEVPEQNFMSVSVGTGWNTNTRHRDFLSTQRGSKDYLGYDDGRRTWMGNSFDRNEYARLYNTGIRNAAEYGARIPNNWGLYKYDYRPVQSYQLGAGRVIRLKDNASLGFVAGGTYRNEQTIEDFDRLNPTYYKITNGQNYNFNTTWALLANIAFQTKHSKLSWKNTMTRRFSNESAVYSGTDDNYDETANYYDIVLMNQLYNARVEGEHFIGRNNSIGVQWFGDYSSLTREQPDTRFVRSNRNSNQGQPDEYQHFNLSDGGNFSNGVALYSSMLTEKRYNAGTSVSKKVLIAKREQVVKAGYAFTQREADFESVGYRVKTNPFVGNPNDYPITGNPDYIAFAQEHFAGGELYYLPTGPTAGMLNNSGEEYRGTQKLHAAYVMLDIKPLEKLRLIGGVRMEDNEMSVTGAFYTNGAPAVTTFVFRERNFLPSASMIYSITKKMNVRLAYSETLARPDFRERQDFKYWDFKDMVTYLGYTGLKDVFTTNIDVRYEWYPSPGEVFSITGFYKHFTNPVEIVAFVTSGNNSNMYFNLDESSNIGMEFDFRKSLGFISDRPLLKNLFVHGNFTLMKSEVKYDRNKLYEQMTTVNTGDATDIRERPLQGLSPYVINAGISYVGERIGVSTTYNRFGRRIRFAGTAVNEDLYENARDVIDLQVSARFLRQKLEVKLNVSDLLNQRFIVYKNTKHLDGDLTVGDAASEKDLDYNEKKDLEWYGYKKGSNMGISVSYRF